MSGNILERIWDRMSEDMPESERMSEDTLVWMRIYSMVLAGIYSMGPAYLLDECECQNTNEKYMEIIPII